MSTTVFRSAVLSTTLLVVCIVSTGTAQNSARSVSATAVDAPIEISFQGYLEDGGVPADGTYKFEFSLRDFPTAGLSKWSETHNSVPVADGIYNLMLGSVNSLANVDFDDDLWLRVEVNDGPEILPRAKIVGVPYSFMALEALDLRLPASIEGTTNVSGNELLKLTQNGTGDVLEIDGGGSASTGILIRNVDLTGLSVSSEFSSGIAASTNSTTGGSALSISNAGGDGIYINNAGDNGIEVARADGHAFHFKDVPSSSLGANLTAYVGIVENTSTNSSADALAIQIETPGNPGIAANFIGFFDGDDDLIGQIEGNGSGGVAYNTTGADYAEYLPHLDSGSRFLAGDVVGVFDGKITRRTAGARQIMVITDRAAVLGNAPIGEKTEGLEAVSFIGQVPVRVSGPVTEGDYLVASGNDDGTAVAVSPNDVSLSHVDRLVGRAWESSHELGVSRVNVVVGLDRGDVLSGIIRRQEFRLESQEQAIEELRTAFEDHVLGHSTLGTE